MEVSKEILNDIADSLEAGFKCFLHRETFEVVTYLDPDQFLALTPTHGKEKLPKSKGTKRSLLKLKTCLPQKVLRLWRNLLIHLRTAPQKSDF